MLDTLWNSWGASVIGPFHVKAGIPNQDSWMVRRYKWGNVVVVSDGLGSEMYSDQGSRAACLAVFEAAKSYQNNPNADIVDILRLIHTNWLVKIAPYSPSDCSATCLFAMRIGDNITLCRLGDGMIVVYGESGLSSFVLQDNKEDSFSNYTNSLQQEFKPEQWEIKTIESTECIAVVLCTDGISDDLSPNREIAFAQEFVTEYNKMTPRNRSRKIKQMLNNWPVPHHSDDKTIACLFRRQRAR